jgi:hypothetical protein
MRVMGFHHGPAGHYGVPAASHYDGLGHPGLAFARPLPQRAPVFNHQHPPHPQPHPHGRLAHLSMADHGFMTADDEFAHLQKLSSEYEPEATVRLSLLLPARC